MMCAPVLAAADEITPVQPASDAAAIAPDQALVFEIDASVPDARIQNFFLEVDGVDVTAEVTLDGRRVSYRPQDRFTVGDHVVRLFEHVGDENYHEVTRWVVRVAATAAEDTQIWGEVTAQYDLLLADHMRTGYSTPAPHAAVAFAEVNALTGGAQWDLSAQISGHADSVRENNSDEQYGQLGAYGVTGRAFFDAGRAVLRLGNHDAGVRNLLVDSFNRRGVSLQVDSHDRVRMTLFAQDPARAIGDSNVTGVADEAARATGAHLAWHPLGFDTPTYLEASVVQGRGREKGYASALIDNPALHSDGWQVAAQWQGMGNRVRLRADYARTDTDFDGPDAGLAALADDAIHTTATVAVIGDIDPRTYNALNWTWGLAHARTGTYFHALTHAGLVGDQDRLALTTDIQHNTLSLQAEGFRVKGNVNDLILPTDVTYGLSAQATLTPSYFARLGEGLQWWDDSVFNLGVYRHNTQRDATPDGFAGEDTRYLNTGGNVGWNASFDDISLSLAHTYTAFRDKVSPDYDQVSHLSEVALTFAPSGNFSITPSLQREWVRYGLADDLMHYFFCLDISHVWIDDVLTHHTYGALQLNDTGRGYGAG